MGNLYDNVSHEEWFEVKQSLGGLNAVFEHESDIWTYLSRDPGTGYSEACRL